MKIFVLGGASYDTIYHFSFLPEPKAQTLFPKKTIKAIGSTGIGKSIQLSKLGFDVTFHAMIGDDSYGKEIIDAMKKNNVQFIYDIDPKGTKTHTNLINDLGQRISIFENGGTYEPKVNQSQILKAIKDADVIVLNIINYTRRFIDVMKRLGKPIWVDIHDYDLKNPYYNDYIDAADFLLMSLDQVEEISDFASLMVNQNKLFLTTNGQQAAKCYTKDHIYTKEVIKTNHIKDFNGAGDHFFSGFLYGYLKFNSIDKALTAGAYLATSCIESDEISNDEISENWLLEKIK